jgi:hypothetical protein
MGSATFGTTLSIFFRTVRLVDKWLRKTRFDVQFYEMTNKMDRL